MNNGPLPLLLFSAPIKADREGGQGVPPSITIPTLARQAQRLGPKLTALQEAFEAHRLELAAAAPNADPDMVVVLETAGLVEDFISSVQKTPGLEWLSASYAEFEPDEDFFDAADDDRKLGGKMFLLGSNRVGLEQLVSLWARYQADPKTRMPDGLSAWKNVFPLLIDVRFWGPADRLARDLREKWEFQLTTAAESLRFEIEAWPFASEEKAAQSSASIRERVAALRGRILSESRIPDISYHGFLVEVPRAGVRELLEREPLGLLKSDRVMFLRAQGQAFIAHPQQDDRITDGRFTEQVAVGPPLVAMLDGLPIENHARLRGRLVVHDPDGWAASSPAATRIHGTAIAALIAWGDHGANEGPIPTPIYVRPIIRPGTGGNAGIESSPDDILLIDLVHIAVREMFEAVGGRPPTAPSVRVINLSLGDASRDFAGELSPWARLIDWLSWKYNVLFIVSCGNASDSVSITVERDRLSGLRADERARRALLAHHANDSHRRIISPAESINALTVGSTFTDASVAPNVPRRYTLFPERSVAPYSRIGSGFRRAVKPDIVVPGGRCLFMEEAAPGEAITRLDGMWQSSQPPGQLTAAPPSPAGDAIHTRGTSNSAAITSRNAVRAKAAIDVVRAQEAGRLGEDFDAVLVKALLVHGASTSVIADQILGARADVIHWLAQKRLISRYAGYGAADFQRAFTCSEERATLLGIGELKNEKALEFSVPIPTAFSARLVKKRVTVTLAWISPLNSRHSKYRVGRLWFDFSRTTFALTRIEGEERHSRLGTVEHGVFEHDGAFPVVANESIGVRVNCVADAGRLYQPVKFGLCVSIEAVDALGIPVYQQVRDRVGVRIRA